MKKANLNVHPISPCDIKLSMGHSARADFYELFITYINECAAGLGKHQVLKLSEICDAYFWKKIDNWQKGVVGRCMAKMVRDGMVRFKRISGKGTCKYQSI